MFKNYIKIAWRNLLKNKVSTIINSIGLSIGISACILILIFVTYESSFDDYHTNASRTYRVVQHNKLPDQTLYWNTTAYPLAEALRNDFPDIDMVTQTAGPMSREFSIQDQERDVSRFEESEVLFADAYYLRTFDTKWLAGNPDTALNDLNSIVLTQTLVEKYFPNDQDNLQSIMGKTILLQGKDPLKITGVVKDPPPNSNQRYSLLIPYEFFKVNNTFFANNWSGNYQGTTFVVLQNKDQRKLLESKITTWKKKYLKPEDDARISYALQPLQEIHNETLYGSSPGGYIIPTHILYTALLVALFILIIAIVNFVNLITAQSVSRSKEVGIRKALGSKRLDIVIQFLIENGMMIIITLISSILIVHVLIHQLNSHLSIINLKLEFGIKDIGIIIAIGTFTILLAAIYPAIVLSAFKPVQALKNKIRIRKTGAFNFRRSLIVFQFIIVQIFVIAAIIVAFQMDYFKNEPKGFSSSAVITTSVPNHSKLDIFKNILLENTSITDVAYGSGPPMAVNGFQLGTSFRLPEQNIQEAKDAEMKVAGTNYLKFYDLKLIAGRNFTTNKEAFDEFIVNETLVKSYNWTPEEAIGKKIEINEGQATIVGVVKDYHNNSFQYEITPCILLNWSFYHNQAFIKINDPNPEALASLEKTWKNTFPNAVYDYHFLDDAIEKEYVVEGMIYKGFTLFSILAISIGCLGLFGLMSFIISRKKKEIGLRKVLGANVAQIISFFSKEFIQIVVLAFVLAVPFVYYMMNLWLEGFTYRITISIWMFLGGGVLTLFIALVTCSFQSIKAAFSNPINALREE